MGWLSDTSPPSRWEHLSYSCKAASPPVRIGATVSPRLFGTQLGQGPFPPSGQRWLPPLQLSTGAHQGGSDHFHYSHWNSARAASLLPSGKSWPARLGLSSGVFRHQGGWGEAIISAIPVDRRLPPVRAGVTISATAELAVSATAVGWRLPIHIHNW